MSRGPGQLLQRGATTLGFILLLPGAVMLMWFYSTGGPGAQRLHVVASTLCASGAAFLLAAIALGLGLRLCRNPGAQEDPADEQQAAVTVQEGQRQNHLLSVPSYHSVVADHPPNIWTVASDGTSSTPQEEPPCYESVVSAEAAKSSDCLPPGGGPRRVGSDSEATLGPSRLGPGPSCPLEPLTPPPRYELTPSGPVFTFQSPAPGV